MTTQTRRNRVRRLCARRACTALTGLMAATMVVSAAGAATAPPAPRGIASGTVASVTGSSMEVQNPSSGQTTVSWTATTAFSKTVTKTLGALSAGTCISVTGTPAKKSKTTIAASSITINAASATGTCTSASRPGPAFGSGSTRRGGPGGGGFGGFGAGGGPARTFRSGLGGSAARRFPSGGTFSIASGKITAVSGSTISMSGIQLTPGILSQGSTKSTKSKKPVQPKSERLKITTSKSTSITQILVAVPSDVVVGACVSAFGSTATNGAVTSTSVHITSTGASSCTTGFGGGPGFVGGRGFGGGGAGA